MTATHGEPWQVTQSETEWERRRASLGWRSAALLCVSMQKESVALSMSVIDESEVRGYKLHVEAARFELKGQYDASKKKKKSKEYKKKMQQQQK